jgi:hypothetical protein
MLNLGTVRPGSTIRIPFSTFDKDDGSSITMTNYAAADILVYKNGSTTERASTAGFTATTDFDAKTGKHLAIIDLADNTTADFWNAGAEYLVAIDAVTVDAVTTGGWIARFVIGYQGALIDTTIATLASQTSFTLTAGPAEDDAINGFYAIIHDIASAVQISKVLVLDYTGSTKTVTLAAGATFTAAAGDNFSLIDMAPLQSTTTGRTLDVSTGGEAGVDWANVGSPTTTVALSGTTVAVATTLTNAPSDSSGVTTLLSRLSSARAGYLDNLSAGAVALASSLTSLSGVFTGITSLAQWLGLIAGKQTGNSTARTELRATGAGSGTFDETTDSQEALRDRGDAAWITATGFSTLDASGVRAAVGLASANLDTQLDALPTAAENATAVWGAGTRVLTAIDEDTTTLDLDATIRAAVGMSSANLDTQLAAIDDYIDTEVAAIKVVTDRLNSMMVSVGSPNDYIFTAAALALAPTGSAPSAAAIADAVWDEAIAGHAISGSTGEALAAAGASGDPWITSLPGSYSAGQAGYILGTNLNATVSSRASQTSVDTVDDFLDTEVAAIKAVTDKLNTTMQSVGSPNDYVFTAAALALGPSGGLDASGVRAAIGLASANLDTQLDALPTNSELSTALASADDAVLAVLGTPAGVSFSADVAAVKAQTAAIEADTQDLQSRTPATLVSGRMDASVGAMASNVMTAAAAAADLTTELQNGLATASALSTVEGKIDTIDTNVDSILDDTGTAGVVVASGSKTGYRLSSTGVDDVLDEVIEGTTTLRESVRLANSALGGKASGLETTSAVFRDLADTKDRLTATVDADGNRTAVTRDLT